MTDTEPLRKAELHSFPAHDELVRAYLHSDSDYEGIFVTAVRTTGIFCRPSCPARKPKPENVEFFPTAREALASGYRPCLRCRPMAPLGEAPSWLAPLIVAVENEPSRVWTDTALRDLKLEPTRVASWFKANHGLTFHSYSRLRRLGTALEAIQRGEPVAASAFAAGYESLSAFNVAFRKFVGAAPSRARATPAMYVARITTDLGPMLAVADATAIVLLEFTDRRMLRAQLREIYRRIGEIFIPQRTPVLQQLEQELAEYFSGARRSFEVPIRTPSSTFTQTVWSAIRAVPYGMTRTYQEIATSIGRPEAARAVRRATGDNRLALLLPCHRVTGDCGELTGYGGGLWRKRWLLELEGARYDDTTHPAPRRP